MKPYLVALLLALSAVANLHARQVVLANQTDAVGYFAFTASSNVRNRVTVQPGSTATLEIRDDVDSIHAYAVYNYETSGDHFRTVLPTDPSPETVTPASSDLSVLLYFTGASYPSVSVAELAVPLPLPRVSAPSIDDVSWQASLAAGFAVWIVPISAIALIRIARKGVQTGGTVL